MKRSVRPRLVTEQGKGSAEDSDRITSAGKSSLSLQIKFRTTIFYYKFYLYIPKNYPSIVSFDEIVDNEILGSMLIDSSQFYLLKIHGYLFKRSLIRIGIVFIDFK